MHEVVGFIYNSDLSTAIRVAGWAIPVLQTVHILAIAGLLASAILLNLRLVGWLGNDADTLPIVARYQRPFWGSLLVLLASGLALLWAEPDRVLLNQSFWIKMGLLLVGIALAFATRKCLLQQDGLSVRSGGRYIIAAAALATWAAVIVYGRWIAYTY